MTYYRPLTEKELNEELRHAISESILEDGIQDTVTRLMQIGLSDQSAIAIVQDEADKLERKTE